MLRVTDTDLEPRNAMLLVPKNYLVLFRGKSKATPHSLVQEQGSEDCVSMSQGADTCPTIPGMTCGPGSQGTVGSVDPVPAPIRRIMHPKYSSWDKDRWALRGVGEG